MFWTLPCVRSPCLLRLLVTYQIMWDYLDTIGESRTVAGQASGLQLHLALADALDPGRPISDYYCHYPSRDDGGYLCALVLACRECCIQLPSFQCVRSLLVREAGRVNVQAINHDLDPASRDAGLRKWVVSEFPGRQDVQWFELGAAAGANIAIYALFALAAEPTCDDTQIARIYRAYFPWTSALATMLDSFVDQEEDIANGDQSYVAYYETSELATQHIARLVQRCLYETQTLGNSERHKLIATCMVAMYLSKDSARTPAIRPRTQYLVNAGGSLTRLLLPILRTWRIAFRQRST
jgi:tetraprenyl-beta-curcumene synthase